MYFTSGAKVSTIRLRSCGSLVSRYFFHSASVSSWEMRLRLLGSSFIGSSGSFGRGGSRVDRPEGRGPLATLDKLRPFPPAGPAWHGAGTQVPSGPGRLSGRSVPRRSLVWPYACLALQTPKHQAPVKPSASTHARRRLSRPAT